MLDFDVITVQAEDSGRLKVLPSHGAARITHIIPVPVGACPRSRNPLSGDLELSYRPQTKVVEIVSLHQFMRDACDAGEGKPRSAESLARYVAAACAEALDRTVAYRMRIEVRPKSTLVIEGVVTG